MRADSLPVVLLDAHVGAENSEVVKATNAVSATRNTLNGSTKNCSSQHRHAARRR